MELFELIYYGGFILVAFLMLLNDGPFIYATARTNLKKGSKFGVVFIYTKGSMKTKIWDWNSPKDDKDKERQKYILDKCEVGHKMGVPIAIVNSDDTTCLWSPKGAENSRVDSTIMNSFALAMEEIGKQEVTMQAQRTELVFYMCAGILLICLGIAYLTWGNSELIPRVGIAVENVGSQVSALTNMVNSSVVKQGVSSVASNVTVLN